MQPLFFMQHVSKDLDFRGFDTQKRQPQLWGVRRTWSIVDLRSSSVVMKKWIMRGGRPGRAKRPPLCSQERREWKMRQRCWFTRAHFDDSYVQHSLGDLIHGSRPQFAPTNIMRWVEFFFPENRAKLKMSRNWNICVFLKMFKFSFVKNTVVFSFLLLDFY